MKTRTMVEVVGALLLIILFGFGWARQHSAPPAVLPAQSTRISEDDAAQIALQAYLDSKKSTLSASCISADTVRTATDSIDFNIREIHNAACGGDPMTAPRLESYTVNLQTGKATLEQ